MFMPFISMPQQFSMVCRIASWDKEKIDLQEEIQKKSKQIAYVMDQIKNVRLIVKLQNQKWKSVK